MTLNEARQVAARIWCDPDFSCFEMNVELADKIAHLLLEEANNHVMVAPPSGKE